MLLDKLLDTLELELRAFAVYEVRTGWQLAIPARGQAGLHCLLQGRGRLRGPGGTTTPLEAPAALLIPEHCEARIEPLLAEGDIRGSGWVDPARADLEVARVDIGQPEAQSELRLACAAVQATANGGISIFGRMPGPQVIEFGEEAAFAGVFVGLDREQREESPGRSHMMRALMQQALILVLRQLCRTGTCRLPWLAGLDDPRLARALSTMMDNPSHGHSVESLARTAGMSRSSFSTHFAETFGTPPMEFLRHARLQRAAELLRRSDMPIDRIAARVGFASRSAFSRAFKQRFSRDPSEYRSKPET